MKPLQKISPDDLQKKKVWKYFSDLNNDDTAMVESTDLIDLTESDDEVYIALTLFSIDDGTTFIGYCSPTDFSGLDYIQPVILFEDKHIALWNGISANELSNILNKKISDIFPIRFECQVPVDGEILKSKITLNEVKNA
jgi:hypothetical protein